MRDLVIGDIHGNAIALDQVLKRSKYDPSKDRLITIGDYTDGYPESAQVIQKLIDFQKESGGRNVHLMGNHDEWTLDLLTTHLKSVKAQNSVLVMHNWSNQWIQGGQATYNSYAHFKGDYDEHVDFLRSLKYYHIENDIAFVHGGWNYQIYTSVEEQFAYDKSELVWNRTLWERAMHLQYLINKQYDVSLDKKKFGKYDTIYIGHTATVNDFPNQLGVKCCNVINVDSGAGWMGVLTCYDITNNIIYSSDHSTNLYPGYVPRKK